MQSAIESLVGNCAEGRINEKMQLKGSDCLFAMEIVAKIFIVCGFGLFVFSAILIGAPGLTIALALPCMGAAYLLLFVGVVLGSIQRFICWQRRRHSK